MKNVNIKDVAKVIVIGGLAVVAVLVALHFGVDSIELNG